MDGIIGMNTDGKIGIVSIEQILGAKLKEQARIGMPTPTGDFGEIPNRYENGIYYPGSDQHISHGRGTITPLPNPLGIKPKKV